jgi:anti-anti-sigma regulatory factor
VDRYNVELRSTAEECRLILMGKLDVFEVDTLLQAAREAVETGQPIVIEVTGLERIDTSIFQILLALQQEAHRQNQSLQVIGACPAIHRIGHLLGGDRHLFNGVS